MGFFGLFGKSDPTEKQIAKQVNHLKEQYAKQEYRQMAMDQLFKWGTREALVGLLSRFQVVVQSPHWDEQEKRWLVDELVERGEMAKEVLKEFVMTEDEVTYPIQALARLCTPEELLSLLEEALHSRSPDDYRSSEGKMELIAALEEHHSPNLALLVSPYLQDHHDDIKCIALDVLSRTRAQAAYPAMIAMLQDSSHSARVLRHAASKVSELKLELPADSALAPEVSEDFELKSGHLVHRS